MQELQLRFRRDNVSTPVSRQCIVPFMPKRSLAREYGLSRRPCGLEQLAFCTISNKHSSEYPHNNPWISLRRQNRLADHAWQPTVPRHGVNSEQQPRTTLSSCRPRGGSKPVQPNLLARTGKEDIVPVGASSDPTTRNPSRAFSRRPQTLGPMCLTCPDGGFFPGILITSLSTNTTQARSHRRSAPLLDGLWLGVTENGFPYSSIAVQCDLRQSAMNFVANSSTFNQICMEGTSFGEPLHLSLHNCRWRSNRFPFHVVMK